jgi:DNA ligase-1
MLAQTAADVGEALREFAGGEVAFEWKLDGARIQVHKRGPEVRIYTRALNEVTEAVPEIVEMARALPAAEVILDGEAIALDARDRPRPFQITMRRFGRKVGVETLRGEIPLRAFFFDCLRLAQRTLADCPAHERFAALAAVVPEAARVPRLITATEAQARAFYLGALDAGHEGVMAKPAIAARAG